MSEKTKEFDRIWLQTCGDSMSEWYGDITWCHDKIHDDDVGYVNEALYDIAIAQRDELLAALIALVNYDNYETEYDGRMYSICHSCGKQDHNDHGPNCEFSAARAAIAKVKQS